MLFVEAKTIGQIIANNNYYNDYQNQLFFLFDHNHNTKNIS